MKEEIEEATQRLKEWRRAHWQKVFAMPEIASVVQEKKEARKRPEIFSHPISTEKRYPKYREAGR